MRQFILVFILGFLAPASLLAVDVSSSKDTVPKKFIDPPGKRYSLFAGDPERVQRANEVKIEDFVASLKIDPAPISLAELGATDEVQFSLVIENTSKRAYTLSFPDSQRFDLAIVTPSDDLVYLWSENKAFVEQTGMSFINGGEKIQFSEKIKGQKLKSLVVPGAYKVVMILANYPEIKAAQDFNISP
ncbi:MAG: BsuPI-related putative proteinase inhibitor [Verrucomicrobiota bacterium]